MHGHSNYKLLADRRSREIRNEMEARTSDARSRFQNVRTIRCGYAAITAATRAGLRPALPTNKRIGKQETAATECLLFSDPLIRRAGRRPAWVATESVLIGGSLLLVADRRDESA